MGTVKKVGRYMVCGFMVFICFGFAGSQILGLLGFSCWSASRRLGFSGFSGSASRVLGVLGFSASRLLGERCTVYVVRCTVHGVRCAVHGVRCAVHGIMCM